MGILNTGMYSTQTLGSILLEPTSYCNARCPQCDRFDEKNNLIVPLRHLEVSVLKRNLDPENLPSLKKVTLEGNCGDVLSHKDPMGLVSLFSHVDMVEMVTNGSVRNEDFFRDLAKFENTRVVFSVDGLADTNHMYRQECDFDRIMSNARAYISAGGRAYWKFIVFRHNEHQVDEARNVSQRMGFQGFWTQVSDRSWYRGNTYPVYNRGVYQFDLERATELGSGTSASDLGDQGKRAASLLRSGMKVERCPCAEDREVFIDHGGRVIPCCMLSHDLWARTPNRPFLDRLLPVKEHIDLNQRHISEVFQSHFYRHTLPESLGKRPMPTCLLHCGNGAQIKSQST